MVLKCIVEPASFKATKWNQWKCGKAYGQRLLIYAQFFLKHPVTNAIQRTSFNYSARYGHRVISFLLSLFFWSYKNTFSQFLCLFPRCRSYLFIFCMCPCVLHHKRHCARVRVCFISCLCFNSNPSSHHTFPADD